MVTKSKTKINGFGEEDGYVSKEDQQYYYDTEDGVRPLAKGYTHLYNGRKFVGAVCRNDNKTCVINSQHPRLRKTELA